MTIHCNVTQHNTKPLVKAFHVSVEDSLRWLTDLGPGIVRSQ